MSAKTGMGSYRPGLDLFGATPGRRITLPFRRSPLLILVLLVFAAAFTWPVFDVVRSIDIDPTTGDTLFDLVGTLFSAAWLLGWSFGLLAIYILLLVAVFGGETLILRPGAVEIRVGLPGVFIATIHDPAAIRQLEYVRPEPKSEHGWRGPCVRFESAQGRVAFGSDIGAARATELIGLIRALPAAPITQASADTGAVGLRTVRPHDTHDTTEKPAGPWSPSTVMLLLANLLPIIGVLWLGWDLGTMMLLFWAESGIIGFFNVLKMAVIGGKAALVAVPFFIAHFGGFMAAHLLFVYSIFITGEHGQDTGQLPELARYFSRLWPMLLALFLSHGLSFFANFIGQREYAGKDLREQMKEPYQRILVMHLTIILGGGISLALGEPRLALLVLVMVKIMVDMRAHLRQRSRASGSRSRPRHPEPDA